MTSDTPQISEREREILRLVATGATNQQIAQTLNISINTVKVHLRNIFAKIGAASRTEATVYAMRMGLFEMPPGQSAPADQSTPASQPEPATPEPIVVATADPAPIDAQPQYEALPVANAEPAVPSPAPAFRRWIWPTLGFAGILVIVAIARLFAPQIGTPPQPTPQGNTLNASQSWSDIAPMPQGHAAFGLAAYESNGKQYLYAIAGMIGSSIDSGMQRYDIQSNTWSSLAPKPTAVGDIHAAVLGKRIYVPGGKLASGQPTATLEAYDQQDNRWITLSDMPAPRSGYALAAFEGKLYLFGGWDGSRYCDEVFSYTPDTDSWQQLTAMPTARAFAATVLVGQDIYVVGGENEQGSLTSNERYTPADDTSGTPWKSLGPMPMAASHIAAASTIANERQIYTFAAELGKKHMIYHVAKDAWETVAMPQPLPVDMRIALVNNKIYIIGGQLDGKAITQGFIYQPVFVILLPQINQSDSR
ncbi:hypothetical protein F8S13_16370 [Chloroflexia bacterium SDU3-3]|nr:hypothetical protein F8S13_16370 [Chloroflexia bacterium SDU3-3]